MTDKVLATETKSRALSLSLSFSPSQNIYSTIFHHLLQPYFATYFAISCYIFVPLVISCHIFPYFRILLSCFRMSSPLVRNDLKLRLGCMLRCMWRTAVYIFISLIIFYISCYFLLCFRMSMVRNDLKLRLGPMLEVNVENCHSLPESATLCYISHTQPYSPSFSPFHL